MRPKLGVLVRPEPLGGRVYATLREYLRSGRIVRGEPLQEVAIAAQLGVSRTPVREALVRLASEGLVTADGRGLTATVLTVSDAEEIYALRLLLEPEAVRLVAARALDEIQLAPMRRTLADMVAAHAASDTAAFIEANYGFRTAWLELVTNRRLVRAIELYADHVRYMRVLTLCDPGVRSGVVARLRGLSRAVELGDAGDAARRMSGHLLEAKAVLLAQIRKSDFAPGA
ncbi:MAG: GntR family transcriptional regulator [Steroidobacteraceae bacterium]